MLERRLINVLRGLYKIKGVHFLSPAKRREGYVLMDKCGIDFVCTMHKSQGELKIEVFGINGSYPAIYIIDRLITELKIASIDCDPYYSSGTLMHLREVI